MFEKWVWVGYVLTHISTTQYIYTYTCTVTDSFNHIITHCTTVVLSLISDLILLWLTRWYHEFDLSWNVTLETQWLDQYKLFTHTLDDWPTGGTLALERFNYSFYSQHSSLIERLFISLILRLQTDHGSRCRVACSAKLNFRHVTNGHLPVLPSRTIFVFWLVCRHLTRSYHRVTLYVFLVACCVLFYNLYQLCKFQTSSYLCKYQIPISRQFCNYLS